MTDPQNSILVIDDDANMAELISDFCSGMGYEVEIITDSATAFETAKRLKPQLITLDLQMPGIDGFEILRRLKGDAETQNIPVIILSVVAGDAERQGLLATAQAIFSKPINFKKLKDKVDQYVKSKKT